MFKALIDLGYIEESYEDILNGNMSDKTREYFRWYNIPNLREYNNWLEQYNNCQNDEEKENLKDNFYNHYGVTKYVPDNLFSLYNYKESALNNPSERFMNNMVIVYKGKFYKGRVGFFDFVNDYFEFGLVRDPDDLDGFLDQLARKILALIKQD